MKIKNTLICFLFFIFFSFSSYSQQLEQKGLGVEDYSKEGLFTDKTLIVEKAIKKACKNAFEPINKGKLGTTQGWRKEERFKKYY